MLDFPNAPTINQTFTGPRGVFRWDGIKWTPYASGADAPTDGGLYGRLNTTWAKAVPLAGGTMTGLLTLSGNPTDTLGAVTKLYADTKVALAGGTMTGLLTLSADPTVPLGAATKQYADTKVALAGGVMTGLLMLSADPSAALGAATKQYVDAHSTGSDAPSDGSLYGRLNATWSRAVPLAGGTMTGLLTLSADPAANLGAATKQYADTKLARTGGTMTGTLTLVGNPSGTLDAATKGYVDGLVTTYATPTAALGLTAIPGTATTAMRSDAAPALSQSILPTWTGKHAFNAGLTSAALVDVAGTVRSTAQTVPASGAGLELFYASGSAYVQPVDRGTSQYKPLNINAGNTTFGNTGIVTVQSTTASGSTSTGALVVSGGVGIGGALYTGAGAVIGGNSTINGQLQLNGPINNYANTINVLTPPQTINAGYTQIGDSSNRGAMLLGGTNDPTIYLRDTNVYLQGPGGSPNMLLATASNVQIPISTASGGIGQGALIVTGGASFGGYLYSQCVNGRNAGTWAGSFINSTVAAGQAGIYVAAGSTPATNDVNTIFAAWTDPPVSAYIGYVCRNGPNAVAYVTSSDASSKVTTSGESTRGLDALREIPVREFYWKSDKDKNVAQGLYAQELADIYPEAVASPERLDADGEPTGEIAWGIDYGRLTPLLIRAVQQLSDRVDELTKRLEGAS